jgi:hypothetical protein
MHEYGMTVVVQINLSDTLTTLSMTRMTALTSIWLGHFVTNIAFPWSVYSHLQNKTERDARLTA